MKLSLLLSALSPAWAHFVLQIPTSLGFDDDAEADSPCGGFNATDRTNVTNFPIKGGAVGVLTTHLNVAFEFKAAKLHHLDQWVNLTRVLHQTGVGDFCEPEIPGPEHWIGENAVLQVIQHGPDGDLYQCAAIKFVRGPAETTPSGCTNSSGTAADWL